MPLTFKSKATGDLVMLQASAEALLKLVGKDAAAPGIIEVADMPRVLDLLRGASTEVPQLPEDLEKMGFADQPVSLHQRAVPLIRMLERALAEAQPVVWGV